LAPLVPVSRAWSSFSVVESGVTAWTASDVLGGHLESGFGMRDSQPVRSMLTCPNLNTAEIRDTALQAFWIRTVRPSCFFTFPSSLVGARNAQLEARGPGPPGEQPHTYRGLKPLRKSLTGVPSRRGCRGK
jgi:hypothetical protein